MEARRDHVALLHEHRVAIAARDHFAVIPDARDARRADERARRARGQHVALQRERAAVELPAVAVAHDGDRQEPVAALARVLDHLGDEDHACARRHHRNAGAQRGAERSPQPFDVEQLEHRRALAARQRDRGDAVEVLARTDLPRAQALQAQRRLVLGEVALQREHADDRRKRIHVRFHVRRRGSRSVRARASRGCRCRPSAHRGRGSLRRGPWGPCSASSRARSPSRAGPDRPT